MAAFIRTGSPVGFIVCGRDWIGEGGLGEDMMGEGGAGVGAALTCMGAAARGIDEDGVEQTKGSVLMDGGGKACWL